MVFPPFFNAIAWLDGPAGLLLLNDFASSSDVKFCFHRMAKDVSETDGAGY